jgi:hypothetical protein
MIEPEIKKRKKVFLNKKQLLELEFKHLKLGLISPKKAADYLGVPIRILTYFAKNKLIPLYAIKTKDKYIRYRISHLEQFNKVYIIIGERAHLRVYYDDNYRPKKLYEDFNKEDYNRFY